MLCISYYEGKGRGVMTNKAILKDELIERVPVIVIPPEQCEDLEKTPLGNYYYGWGEDGQQGAIALGYGSLYNHSYNPNATYVKNYDELSIDYIAIKDINAEEEITISYNQDPDDKTPVWFDVVDDDIS